MDYFVTRLYEQGKPRPKHVQRAVRGALSVHEEADAERRRTVKVARLVMPISQRADEPPPLYDVVLLGLTPDWMSLIGYERLPVGPLQDTCITVQVWLCGPAPIEELIAAERQVNRLSGLLAQMNDTAGAAGGRK